MAAMQPHTEEMTTPQVLQCHKALPDGWFWDEVYDICEVRGMIRTVLWEVPLFFTGLLHRHLAWLTVRLRTS